MSKKAVIERIKSNKKRARTYCNTCVSPYRDSRNGNQMIDIFLFGNLISQFNLTKGTFMVCDGGWSSNTSRDWMRALMSAFQEESDERGLYIRHGIWYNRDPMIWLPDKKRRKFDKDTPLFGWETFKIREGVIPAVDELRKRVPQDILEIVHSFL